MEIVATPGALNANSYITLAWADSYWEADTRHGRWETLSLNDRARAIIQASRQINALRLAGYPLDSNTPQALHFPRDADYNRITQEDFTADLDVAVELDHTQIVGDSELVTSVGGVTEYELDTDYEMDYEAGTITVLATGSMEDATEYTIIYDYLGIPLDIEQATAEQALYLAERGAGGGDGDLIDRVALQAQGVKSVALDGVSETYDGSGGGELCAQAQRLVEPYIVRTARIAARGW